MPSFSISGLSGAIAGLDQFKKTTSRAILERALKRAAKPIADAAKSAAPVKTGRLKASINTAVLRSSPGKAAFAAAKSAGASDDEAGSAAHAANKAAAGSGLSATVRVSANIFYAGLVEFGHQGAPAHPFLGPAYRGNRSAALATISDDISTEIAASARRIAARNARKPT